MRAIIFLHERLAMVERVKNICDLSIKGKLVQHAGVSKDIKSGYTSKITDEELRQKQACQVPADSKSRLVQKREQRRLRRNRLAKRLRNLERKFPVASGLAFSKARKKVLISGQSVLQTENGIIFEVFPDGSRNKIKEIEKPTKIKRGLKLHIGE